MNYNTLVLKTCQNIEFDEYEFHFSQKQKTPRILFIIGKYNHNWNILVFNKNPFLFLFLQWCQVN